METPPEKPGPDVGETEEDSGGEVSLQRIQVINLILTVVGAGASLLISYRFALGVLTGGLVMAANFRIMVGVIRAVFLKGSTSPVNVGIYWAKFTILMFVIGFLVLKVRVDAIGLLCGLSAILVAITLEAVLKLSGR